MKSKRRVSRVGRYHSRPQSTHQPASSNKWQKLKLLALIAVLVAGCAWLIHFFRVKAIVVENTSHQGEIAESVKQLTGEKIFWSNLLFIPPSSLSKEINERHGANVTNIKITKSFKDQTLKISADDRFEAIWWRSQNRLYEVDQTGRVTKEVSGSSNLPLVVDETNIPTTPNNSLVPPQFVSFVQAVHSEMSKASGVEPTQYRIRTTSNELIADTRSGFFVLFDTTSDARAQLQNLKQVLELAKSKNQLPTQYVDLRISYKAYYR